MATAREKFPAILIKGVVDATSSLFNLSQSVRVKYSFSL